MQNEKTKLEIINYIEKASVVVLGLLFILFPVFFTNITTDFFLLPKQGLLIFASLVLILLYGIKTVLMEKISIRRTPFDIAVLLFLLAIFLSSVFSVAIYNSFTNFIPLLFVGLSFFIVVNSAKNEKFTLVLASSLLAGAVLLSFVTVFSYFKIYVFPFEFTKSQLFTPSGSLLEQALYLLFTLPLGVYFLSPFLFGKKQPKATDAPKIIGFGLASIIILIGLCISIYSLVRLANPPLLPMEAGFQTGLSAISKDSERIFKGLLFGSGLGEYHTVFSRFKEASFNANQALWSFSFTRSSSFVLELLATTGILGILSFLFLCYKIFREKPLFIPLLLALGISFILPFSFYTVSLIFFLLGIYCALRGLSNNQKYFDVELELVALKKGFFAFALEEKTSARTNTKSLAYVTFSLIVIIILVFGFLSYDFLSTNVTFQKSLVAASQNNGQLTYTYQNSALSTLTGRYVDSYHRIFSQTNLALANTVATSIPQGTNPSAETTQTIYTLVQQSVNSGRQATTLSPKNTLNWQSLSSIYRALIGFGQNADSFAILAQQQAVQLDPSNPQEYINLGGIYYQLRSWDNALAQFQQAINLKPDFPNAYYNFGHALEEKGDLRGALSQYQTVRSLVVNDQANLGKIDAEINVLVARIGQLEAAQNTQAIQNQTQEPLSVPTPETTLPKQNPPLKIPGPSETTTPTPTSTPTASPSPTQ